MCFLRVRGVRKIYFSFISSHSNLVCRLKAKNSTRRNGIWKFMGQDCCRVSTSLRFNNCWIYNNCWIIQVRTCSWKRFVQFCTSPEAKICRFEPVDVIGTEPEVTTFQRAYFYSKSISEAFHKIRYVIIEILLLKEESLSSNVCFEISTLLCFN